MSENIIIKVPGLTPVEYLQMSRDHLADEMNWRKGGLGVINGAQCALGALSAAAGVIERVKWSTNEDDYREFLAYPIDDNNGLRDAVTFLYEALPEGRGTAPQRYEETLKRHTAHVESLKKDPEFNAKQIAEEEHFAPKLIDFQEDNIYNYNDANATTHSDVVAWFNRALEAAKSA